MKTLYVRGLTSDEYQALEKGLKAQTAFTVRRSQILLHSASGLKASQIAQLLHCSDETVRAVQPSQTTDNSAGLKKRPALL